MAESGSYDYSLTADDIITAAAEDIKVVSAGEAITTSDYAVFLRTLNMLVKQWSAMADFAPGLKVFSRKRVAMWLAKGQHQYSLGPSNAKASVSYGRTTLDAAEAAGQTVISVAATSDTTTDPGTTITATAADIVGIELDDGTIHWSTIASISAGDTITIDDALASAAASGRYLWWFTNYAQRMEIVEAAVLRDKSLQDTPLDVFLVGPDYDVIVLDKYGDGDPTAILVEPQRTTTKITLDSQPQDVTKQIILTGLYPMQDYDNASGTDDIAYPQVWLSALEWELAKRCAPKFGKKWTPDLDLTRKEAIMIAQNQNPQQTTVYAKRDE